MRIHAQLNVFFAGVLIAITTVVIVTAPAQVVGTGQSKSPAVAAFPQDARESAQALHSALPGAVSAEGVGVSRMRTHDARVLTSNSYLSFQPVVTYGSGRRVRDSAVPENAAVDDRSGASGCADK